MTPEEWAELTIYEIIKGHLGEDYCRDVIYARLQTALVNWSEARWAKAVAEERERCARIALGLDSVDRGELTMDDWEHSLRSQTALDIAARIRGSDAPK